MENVEINISWFVVVLGQEYSRVLGRKYKCTVAALVQQQWVKQSNTTHHSNQHHQQSNTTKFVWITITLPVLLADIQGSIYRISSQACAGESSRSGTANVLRNALIWKFHHWSEIIDVMVVVGIDASDCRMSALYAQLPVST